MIRTHNDAGAMAATMQTYLKQRYPDVAVNVTTMRESVGESERPQHFRTLLFGSFAGISILLAMIGTYGVTAYTVTERRFEFALRFALGAQRPQVLMAVLHRALLVAIAGAAAGVLLSLSLSRVAVNLLGKMPELDIAAFAVAVCVVLLTILAATLIPAYRAANIDPMQILRAE
jgi:putative ABC transport system permease protein